MPQEKENASSKHCGRGDATDDYDRSRWCEALLRGANGEGKDKGEEREKGKRRRERGEETQIVTADM